MENLRVLEMAGLSFESLWKEESPPPLQLRELLIENLPDEFSSSSSFLNFPKSIGQLQYLENITIIGFLKSLPEEFCELRSLKYLCLVNCTKMISLPDYFGRLTNLQRIDLSCCSSLRMLPESFCNLTRLKRLDLHDCSELILSSATLGNITTLEYLNISGCLNVTELPPQIEHQRFLKELDMRRANFKELPNWIGNLCNLEALSIGSDSLEVLLPLSLSNLRSLKKLFIAGAPRLKSLPNPFPRLSQLEMLHIEKCGIEHLPQELLKMNNLLCLEVFSCPLLALKEIDLENTEISEAFFLECVCPNLQRLSLRNCGKLTQIGGLCGLSKLQYLDISRCVILEELPNPEMLISLEELDASSCERLRSIPGLGQLKKLKRLLIDGCARLEELPNLEILISLEELKASGCDRLRSIPGLGQLKKLKRLFVDGCVRLEELPNLEMLISLEVLSADRCERLRSIPGLEQLKKLSHLNVCGCHEMLELSGAKHLMLLKRLEAYDCPKLRWGEGELEHLRQRLKRGLNLQQAAPSFWWMECFRQHFFL